MKPEYNKTAIVINDPHIDLWSVSFTSHNPEVEDCVDCKTEEDAWKLKRIWDAALANAKLSYPDKTDEL